MAQRVIHIEKKGSLYKGAAKEQAGAYYSSMFYTKEIPDYVKEDIRIGLK